MVDYEKRMPHTTIRLANVAEKQRLTAAAKRRHLTVSEFVRLSIRERLSKDEAQ